MNHSGMIVAKLRVMAKKTTQMEMVNELKTQFESLGQGANHAYETVKPILEGAASTVTGVFHDVKDAIPADQHKNVLWGIAGLAALVTAYSFGKARRHESIPAEVAHASSEITNDLKPIFKFLKLWMIHKISV
jgi:hypothetical protein